MEHLLSCPLHPSKPDNVRTIILDLGNWHACRQIVQELRADSACLFNNGDFRPGLKDIRMGIDLPRMPWGWIIVALRPAH
jgi:hypothetical protein